MTALQPLEGECKKFHAETRRIFEQGVFSNTAPPILAPTVDINFLRLFLASGAHHRCQAAQKDSKSSIVVSIMSIVRRVISWGPARVMNLQK
jgi:hypothetical protein